MDNKVIDKVVDKAKEIIYNQFETFISFLLTDMGIGYHNMSNIVFYGDKNVDEKVKKEKLQIFYDLLEESNRNYIIFYSKLPLDIKKNLFNYNQEKLLKAELLEEEEFKQEEGFKQELLNLKLKQKRLKHKTPPEVLEQELLEQFPVEYRLKCDFEVFDKLMSCSVKFEKRMFAEAYRFLSKIFYQQFSKKQKMDLDEGKWIDGYNDAIHCYVKWLNYGKRSYIMIKQMRTFWNSFRSYFFATLLEG